MFDSRASVFFGYLVLAILFPLFPRFSTVIFFGLNVAFLLVLLVRRRLAGGGMPQLLEPGPRRSVFLPMMAFALWAVVACLWSAGPLAGLIKVVLLIGLIAMSVGVTETIDEADIELLKAALAGMVVGLLLVTFYIVLETVTERGIANAIFSKFPALQAGYEKHLRVSSQGAARVSDANLNRSTAVYCLLLWPALLVGLRQPSLRFRRLAVGLLALSVLALLVFTRHQSSQVALAASSAIFALAYLWPEATRRLLSLGWIAVLLLIIPLSLAAFNLGLHESSSLFSTARHRVVIWNYTAEQILKTPLHGIGTDSVHAISRIHSQEPPPRKGPRPPDQRPHPHNVYLQVWYELGAVGVALFGWAGLAMIGAIGRLPVTVQPFALAQAAMSFAMIASSYGLWQTWFQASIAFAALALYAAIRTVRLGSGSP